MAALLVGCLMAIWVMVERSQVGLGPLEKLERMTLDARFAFRGPKMADPEIVLVVFDDKTLEMAPDLLQRRRGFASVLDAMGKARVVGVDLFFAEAEEILPADLTSDLREHIKNPPPATEADRASRDLLLRVEDETRGDERLAGALKNAPASTLIFVADDRGETLSKANQDLLGKKATFGQSDANLEGLQGAKRAHASLARFNAMATALGEANVAEDHTRTVRRIELARLLNNRLVMSFSLQLFRLGEGKGRGQTVFLGGEDAVVVGGRRIALNPGRASIWLNARGGRGTYRTVSAVDLVSDPALQDSLSDKVVVLGVSHLGHDLVRTPYGLDLGAAVHATALDNLRHSDFLTRATPSSDALFALLAALWIALLLLPILPGPLWSRVGVGAVGLGLWGTWAVRTFSQDHHWVGLSAPTLATAGALLFGLAASTLFQGRARRQIRKTFSHYLADEIIDELMENPALLTPGGSRRELTVLFSDLRDFTALSEGMEPEALVTFLNNYLSPMTDAIVSSGGFLDKYIGDAVMGVFGAPLPTEEHAAQSLRAADKMAEALERLRYQAGDGGASLNMGIGINTGPMVVGNLGSERRLDYTVIGDAVNLASRLEGLTKYYGVTCIVGSHTRIAAFSEFAFRELGSVRVKGRVEPEAIFELLGEKKAPRVHYIEEALFDQGLAAFRKGDLRTARECFSAFAKQNPDDQATQRYLAKLDALGDETPEGWDGVVVHARK
jgi:adenylate cyclase